MLVLMNNDSISHFPLHCKETSYTLHPTLSHLLHPPLVQVPVRHSQALPYSMSSYPSCSLNLQGNILPSIPQIWAAEALGMSGVVSGATAEPCCLPSGLSSQVCV